MLKRYRISRIMAGMAIVFMCLHHVGVSAQTQREFTQSAWPDTIYYLARLGNPNALTDGDHHVTVAITAEDDYALYIDGEFLGGNVDGDPRTVESYQTTLNKPTVDIAVAVYNDGLGEYNGLMVDIADPAGEQWLGASIEQRRTETVSDSLRVFPVQWYCFDGREVELNGIVGGAWNVAGPGKLTDPEVLDRLQNVSLGNLHEFDYLPNPRIDVITGYRDGVDTSIDGGGITLRRIDGENLALGKSSDQPSLTDGDTYRGVKFDHDPVAEAPDGYSVDLGNVYRINRVVLYTGGEDPQIWPLEAVLGYRVEISLDNSHWEEVGVIHDIGVGNEGGFDHYEVTFPPEWSRYVRFRISESREDYPHVGEMMVYGVGYAWNGSYESDWLDFGEPGVWKHFTTASWEGAEEGITIQIKTNAPTFNGDFAPVDWSEPISDKEFSLEQFIPAPMLQYRINFSTQNSPTAPVLESITFRYTADDPVSVESEEPVATTVFLPHPNPFNPLTTIEYRVGEPGSVTFDIHNASGQKVATLVDEYREPGRYSAVFNGAGMSSGLYFYRFKAGDFEKTGRMMLMK